MSRIKLQARNQKVFVVHISDKEFRSKLRTPAERDLGERERIYQKKSEENKNRHKIRN